MPARQIECIVVERDRLGRRVLTHVGGSGWRLSLEEAICAIRSGSVFFVTLEGESYLVPIETLGEGGWSMLFRLKECGE
jgi:hypothetical protein